MNQAQVIEFPLNRREERSPRKRDRLNARKSGRVYSRDGKLWVDFYYRGERVRERTGLADTQDNRDLARRQLDLIVAEIATGTFEFARRFPHSARGDHFTRLEGRAVKRKPSNVVVGEQAQEWLREKGPKMSASAKRDSSSTLQCHILPRWGRLPFSELTGEQLQKEVDDLGKERNRYGEPLSGKRIRNILIPLRAIVKYARKKYGWSEAEFPDPFRDIDLPKIRRRRVLPFSYDEWAALTKCLPRWYRPYFAFAVQTGLRPSEQVALKWTAIDEEFIHIELSRVRNQEKPDLKTAGSVRSLEIRPSMRKILDEQRELTKRFESEYVFVNTEGRPVRQEEVGEVWQRAIAKSGLAYRRPYETRHTFASRALAAGESPGWVASTLGHVDTAMVYRTYGRYIPNLTRRDGSAFEREYDEAMGRQQSG